MNTVALSSVTHEQGWGTLFSVSRNGRIFDFCVSYQTLQAPGFKHRAKKTFPEAFEANADTLLRAAQMLIESGRVVGATQVGGTEILPEHILEVQNA